MNIYIYILITLKLNIKHITYINKIITKYNA